MHVQGKIDAKQLEELANSGEIDTVLCMFSDLQGRYMGKRVVPHFFLEEILGEEGLHACLYLLAVDMEMEPLPGYRYASWETGYGDFRMVPDMSTLRLVPWLEKTAMVICDVADEETGEPVEVAPRQILKRQIERAKAAGYTSKMGSELEFYLFRDSFEELAGKGYR
ncbi:MAG TPA: glutamine synthetase, partial [Actinomycetota bacterium]|nr:glutamine synthetase [Actinomycetota bacterium]